MLLVSYLTPSLTYKSSFNWGLFVFFSVLSGAFVIWGGYEFRKFQTTVNPIDPSKTTGLVTSGVYRYTRNPMYLGFVLFLVGWASLLSNLISPVVLVLFVWYISKFQIVPEERVLEEKFGTRFVEYKKRVRRWV